MISFMAEMRKLFRLHLLLIYGMVLNLAALGAITAIALIAALTRADCNVLSSNANANSTTGIVEISLTCDTFERISTFVHREASYMQSIHTQLSQNAAALALLVFQPSLTKMVWDALAGRKLTVANFARNVEFANSPGLGYIFNYFKRHRPALSFKVFFVVLVSILSQLSTFAVSPVYRSHKGPFSMNVRIVNGGGIDTSISSQFDSFTDATPKGVIIGKTLISGAAVANVGVIKTSTYRDLLPFIPPNSTQAIWYGTVDTVVARSSLDCGPSATTSLTTNLSSLVDLDPSTFFAPNGAVEWVSPHPSFAGVGLGLALGNEPQLAAVYLNASYVVESGAVTGNASVIFAAANGTIEGSQYKINSPEPTSRIKFVDVLVCTSTTRLEVSRCTVDQGNVTSCDFHPPSNPSAFPMGGVEQFVQRPNEVAMTLAVVPVVAIPTWYNDIPTYDITPDIIENRVLPLPYMTTGEFRPPYNIPLSYVQDVLFGQTAHFFVQGMVSDGSLQTHSEQEISIIATFGASSPALTSAIMALALAISLVAFVVAHATGDPKDLGAVRLISIAKSAKLSEVLNDCSEQPGMKLHSMIAYDHDADMLTSSEEGPGDPDMMGLLVSDEKYNSGNPASR